jgi:FlaG/FlaF family flagellin (archaellin)
LNLRKTFRSLERTFRSLVLASPDKGHLVRESTNLKVQRRNKKSSGIAEIIATLLMILIAVAAAVIVYAYVIGFVGSATVATGGAISIISIDDVCISASSKCPGGYGYFVAVRNVGSTTISGVVQLYFTDMSTGATSALSCSVSSVSSYGVYNCAGSALSGFVQGNSVSLKVVDPDGGEAIASTRVSF